MTGLGAGLGGWALNKATGNPVGKGKDKLKDFFTGKSVDKPLDSTHNSTSHQQNHKTNESKLHNNSFKNMGGLSGQQPTPIENFKTKSIKRLTDFVDNVKGFAGETAELGMKFGEKALGVAGAALIILYQY